MILEYYSKINIALGSIVLLCFFLPWVNIGCGNVTITRLSGFDLTMGHITIDDEAMHQVEAEASRTGSAINRIQAEHNTRPQFYLLVIVVCALGIVGYGVRMMQELNRVGIFAVGAFAVFGLLLIVVASARDFGVDLPQDVARVVHVGHGAGFFLMLASLLASAALSVITLRATSETSDDEDKLTIDLPIPKEEDLTGGEAEQHVPSAHSKPSAGTNAFGESTESRGSATTTASSSKELRCPSCGSTVAASDLTCGHCGKMLPDQA